MSWNAERLAEMIRELRAFGDDTTLVECKTAAGGVPENIGETLCAFANMPQAGAIILGVSERKGFEVTGIENPAEMQKAIASVSRSSVKPAPQLEFFHHIVDGKHVLVVEVTPLTPTEKPARFKNKAYLRQADGDYQMNSNDLKMLELSALTASQQTNFDFQIVHGTDTGVLDGEALRSFIESVRQSRTRLSRIDDDSQLLQISNVTDNQGNLRLGGLYALGYLPQSVEPALGATVAVRLARGDGMGRHRNLKEIEGPLPEMLVEIMNWIRQNSDTVSRYTEIGHLVDEPEFPPSAIREVLANALVHRDLGPSVEVGKKVEVRITEKMLVVVSPGGLRGLSASQLESPELTKAPVNKRLYEIARYLRTPDGERVIEGEGGGIQEILTATREARLPKPQFIDTGVTFKVLFPRGSRFSEIEDKWLEDLQRQGKRRLVPIEEDLLVNLRSQGGATRQRIVQMYAPLGERACRRMLDQLSDNGFLDYEDGVYYAVGEETGSGDKARRKSTDEQILRSLGKNVPKVYEAIGLNGSATMKELQDRTSLSPAQVRYALDPLLAQGYVSMVGGQGRKATVYSRE
ncbi:RNA-binding domain-containing protein [Corynebacterium sp. ACRQJ]|uniref:RNA-binding domain-containing protein n=1 Tax=Corynebacterium sp. ACRQJ TaxID=2918189 RepID=UPI001EF4AC07|nr:RNA-binding domain-containing protein [Corynebacterium sp. ACRQJ]MCG7267275.1 putative DNA binding domain-containing protein [Corynebacterium sp. ACRQJ]